MASKPKSAVLINKKGVELLEHIHSKDFVKIDNKEYYCGGYLIHNTSLKSLQSCLVTLIRVDNEDLIEEQLKLKYKLNKAEIVFECHSIEEFENIIKTLQQVK